MPRAAKRRLAIQGEEIHLYDQDDADAATDAKEYLPLGEDGEEGENHTNGNTPAVPPPVEYLETDTEGELRDIISNLEDTVEVIIAVPEWVTKDGKVVRVLVRSLTGFERGDFLTHMSKVDFDLTKSYADLVILSTRHPVTKKLLFNSRDRGMLNSRMGAAVQRIAMKASDISGLSEEYLNNLKKS